MIFVRIDVKYNFVLENQTLSSFSQKVSQKICNYYWKQVDFLSENGWKKPILV